MRGNEMIGGVRSDKLALGRSRRRVLVALCSEPGPLGVREVAERVGLHVNTARFHLEGLVAVGLVHRTAEAPAQSGRPRMLYMATDVDSNTGRRSYQLLAQILTSYVASQMSRPAEAGRKAGESWGRDRAKWGIEHRPAGANTDTAVGQLVQTLDDIGFDPQLVSTGAEQQVLLHQCPFREAAAEHPEVVCSVHLGIMQGVLAELHATVQTQRLDPLVDPALCVAHLSPTTVARV
jgi:predicted ArsR family transcriptional regulator